MEEKVFKIVSQIMQVPEAEVSLDSSPDSIESWDSLKQMNLVMALEEEFKVSFSDEQIMELLNVGLIVMAIQELQS